MATSWHTALARGWTVAYHVTISGTRWIFSERSPVRTTEDDQLDPPAGRTLVPALVVDEARSISVELDRESGIAAGRALELLLAWDELRAAGVHADAFGRPTASTALTADVDDGDTTINVADTSAFPGSGDLYLGTELIAYTGKTGTTFTGCTRGQLGSLDGQYKADSPSGFRLVTDRPLFWRGRLVDLYAMLISPEGHTSADDWLADDTVRHLWSGVIDDPPRPGPTGMHLRCLPLHRHVTQDVGYEVSADVVVDDDLDARGWLVPIQRYRTVELRAETATGTWATYQVDPWTELDPAATEDLAWATLKAWGVAFTAAIKTQVDGESWWGGLPELSGWWNQGELSTFSFHVLHDSGTELENLSLVVGADAPAHLVPGTYAGQMVSGYGWLIQVRVRRPVEVPTWVLLSGLDGGGWADVDLPSSGIGVLEAGGVSELVRWSEEATPELYGGPEAGAQLIAVYLAERGLAGTPKADPWRSSGAKLRIVTGVADDLDTAILTILESTGTGAAGTFDTLGLGQGYGIDDGRIDELSIQQLPFADLGVVMAQEGRASLLDLAGGWLAAQGYCLAMVYSATASQPVLAAVPWHVVDDPAALTITHADVLLDRWAWPEPVEAPNEVEIRTAAVDRQAPSVIVRDVPAIQQQGPRGWRVDCPSMPVQVARATARSLIYMGAGLVAVELTVGPWVDVQAGDAVHLDLSHPGTWDWAAAARGPSTLVGRVVGWTWDLVDTVQRITVLAAGQAIETGLLCPASDVVAVSGDKLTLTVATGHGAHYTEGENVHVYTPGDGDTELVMREIDTISGDQLTLTVAVPAWVDTWSRVTYPDTGDASARQQRFMYAVATDRWGP